MQMYIYIYTLTRLCVHIGASNRWTIPSRMCFSKHVTKHRQGTSSASDLINHKTRDVATINHEHAWFVMVLITSRTIGTFPSEINECPCMVRLPKHYGFQMKYSLGVGWGVPTWLWPCPTACAIASRCHLSIEGGAFGGRSLRRIRAWHPVSHMKRALVIRIWKRHWHTSLLWKVLSIMWREP